VDYIGMARDFIQEKIQATDGKDAEIIEAIRESVHEIWRDHARFEPGGVDLKLLIGSCSTERALRFTVVSGAAVRSGRKIEAMGIGDATFLGLADRFLPTHSVLSFVPGEPEAIRLFTIYAASAAKQVPGVGGMTRVLTLDGTGNVKWEKSFKVVEVQKFFSTFHNDISQTFSGILADQKKPEELVRLLGKRMVRNIRTLRKNLDAIEGNPSLL
jgi:hypothetical protein